MANMRTTYNARQTATAAALTPVQNASRQARCMKRNCVQTA
jgi:hypothetical protein